MSSPPPPRPAHPTRQQLDELDALLQRMLEPDSAPEPPVEGPPAPPPGPAVSYRIIQPAAEAPAAPAADTPKPGEEQWVPLRSTWQPSPHTWGPLAQSWQQAQAARGAPPVPPPAAPPAQPPALAPEAASPPPIIRPVSGFVQRRPEPTDAEALAAPPVSRWLRPLVWCNRGFDALTAPLGAPGRWLRGRRGRTVLGAVGLLCLAAAVARAVADGIGWTW
jgi:hypothetical protein